jgi:hypothetical protein
MIELYPVVAFALLIVGVAAGITAVVALGIRREDKTFRDTAARPGRAASAARAACGVYTRTPRTAYSPDQRQEEELLVLTGQHP